MFTYARNYRKYIKVATDYVVLSSAHGIDANITTEPVVLLAVSKDFLATFAHMRGYSGLNEFLGNYSAEDIRYLPREAEKEAALMYSYCEQSKTVYVPKRKPEGSVEALCLLQGDLLERDKVGIFAAAGM